MDGLGSNGIPQYSEAAHLFKIAAANHATEAEHLLGMQYEYGLGVPKDFAAARSFYSRAAEKNYHESIYHLALMFAYGRGAQGQDFWQAFPLLERAAREGHAPSTYYMVGEIG